MFKYLFILASLFMLTSCGVTYKPLELERLSFQNAASLKENVTVSYLYDIQDMSRNRRYGKKERKAGYVAVGVRIKNESNQPIQITDNFMVTANGTERPLMSPEAYTAKVKQHPPVHLLHALWGPWQYSYVEYGNQRQSSFRYLPVGAAVGLINLIVAATGNANHEETLKANTIIGRTVEPGNTLNGIILMASPSYEPLTFELRE
jgi:hypothetical protein